MAGRDLSAVRRWLLLATLVAIGLLWCAAFALFRARSVDFVVAAREATAVDAAVRVAPPPWTLRFGRGSADTRLLVSGWHLPDDGGTWSSRREAWMVLPATRSASPAALSIDLVGMHCRGRRPRLRLHTEGAELWSGRLDGPTRLVFDLPASVGRDLPWRLYFTLERIRSPRRAACGPDTRELGVLVQAIEIAARDGGSAGEAENGFPPFD